jgi:hypothetical protein
MTPQTPLPNLRVNALKLGLRLMAAAANPWSGLNSRAADKATLALASTAPVPGSN